MTGIKVPCEVYSRVVGYLRPVQDWNLAKQQEFEDRVVFDISEKHLCTGVASCTIVWYNDNIRDRVANGLTVRAIKREVPELKDVPDATITRWILDRHCVPKEGTDE